jgi:hypothetical protein
LGASSMRTAFNPLRRRLRDERGEAWREPDHAVKRGANLIKITDVTGHNKSLEMLKTYGRDAEAFVGHAGALINNAGVNLIGAVEEDLCLLETGAPDRTFFAPTGQTAPFLEDGGRWIVEQAKHFKPLPGAAWSSGSCGQPLRGPFIACAASLGHSRSPEILDVSRR